MKNILVPTDFSATARNAVNYAIELAKIIKAEITLLHIFDVPVAITDVSVVMPSPSELEHVHKHMLNNYEKELKGKTNNGVAIKGVVKMGYVFDEIKNAVRENKIDLIVMGITGAGKLTELLIGSNATRVIKKIDCPTIVVPEKAKFVQLKKVAFACDYNGVEESKAVDQLVDFVKLLKAQLVIVNIGKPTKVPAYSEDLSGKFLEYVFENVDEFPDIPSDVDYSVYQQKDDDVVVGINRFVDKHGVDLLVMIPRKHSMLSSLFHESNTQRMAFHTHVPLLALHEEH